MLENLYLISQWTLKGLVQPFSRDRGTGLKRGLQGFFREVVLLLKLFRMEGFILKAAIKLFLLSLPSSNMFITECGQFCQEFYF